MKSENIFGSLALLLMLTGCSSKTDYAVCQIRFNVGQTSKNSIVDFLSEISTKNGLIFENSDGNYIKEYGAVPFIINKGDEIKVAFITVSEATYDLTFYGESGSSPDPFFVELFYDQFVHRFGDEISVISNGCNPN